MIAAALLYLGLFALAAAMPRHAPALLGNRSIPHLARIGWGLVALSLLAALLTPDWPVALVTWFASAPLAGGIVLLGLTYAPRFARAGVPVALALTVLGAIG